MPASLINFNVPTTIRQRFNVICLANCRTRTSVLVELMTNYILEEGKRLIERQKELGDLDIQFQESLSRRGNTNKTETNHQSVYSPRQTWGDLDFDIVDPIYSDGQGDW